MKSSFPCEFFTQDGGFDMDHWFNAEQVERIGFKFATAMAWVHQI